MLRARLREDERKHRLGWGARTEPFDYADVCPCRTGTFRKQKVWACASRYHVCNYQRHPAIRRAAKKRARRMHLRDYSPSAPPRVTDAPRP